MSTDPGFQPYPTPAAQPVGPPPPAPRTVSVAFWLYLLAAVLEIVVMIVTVIAGIDSRDRVRLELAKTGALTGRHIDVDMVVGLGIGVSVAFGVIALAAYVVFALLMRRGYGWTRIVLLIVTVLALIGVTGAYGIGAVKAVAAIVATVLAFLPASGAWFRAMKEARRA